MDPRFAVSLLPRTIRKIPSFCVLIIANSQNMSSNFGNVQGHMAVFTSIR